METFQVHKIIHPEDLEKALAVRRMVFVDEQGCPLELEQQHEESSIHFLALSDHYPCGTARWRKTAQGYKLERFAVLKEFRGYGIGRALIATVLADLPYEANYIYLNAQLEAVSLYAKFGFVAEGETFEEAGILHCRMVKRTE